MNIIEKAVDKLIGEVEKSRPEDTDASQDIVEAASRVEQTQGVAPPPTPESTIESAGKDPEPSAATTARPTGEAAVGDVRADAQAETLEDTAVHDAGETAEAHPGAADTNFVSLSNLGREGILTAEGERSRTAEEYRMIKRPLLMRAFGDEHHRPGTHNNLVMLTSSVEGEGKTFTSLNLSISIAMELDRTVLLIDADLAKPGLSRLLNITSKPGLTERLLDESLDLSSLLLHTDVPKLTILPAGRRHRRSTELLGSNNMQRLLDELALRYPDRIVLFDSPPLLATSEASVLAQQMGQICLVVESGVTPQHLVKDALAQLESTENVSLILNKCKPDLFLSNYGYGYGSSYAQGYGYGYGYGYGNDER